MKNIFLHWWHGCAKFNRLYPHWLKADGKEYPICSICGSSGYWMYGYKHFLPDVAAQKVQNTKPSESTLYWAKHDGHI